MKARVARGICGVLRPFGAVVFTFDRPGRGELVLEDFEQAHGRFAMWVETNRNAIEVVKPLELAFVDGNDPIQGMAAGTIDQMRHAEKALNASEWAMLATVFAPSIRHAICRFSIFCRAASPKDGRSSNLPGDSAWIAKRPWPLATTGTMCICWSGQGRA